MQDIASQLLTECPGALDCGEPERCGIVRPDGSMHELANISGEPLCGFIMDPATFLAEIESGAVETWHTHPGRDPALSEEDAVGFIAWPQLTHHIIGIREGRPHVTSYKVIEGSIVVKV